MTAVVTKSVRHGETETVDYPTGFTYSNTAVIDTYLIYSNVKYHGSGNVTARTKSSGIEITMNGGGASDTLSCGVMLLKIL